MLKSKLNIHDRGYQWLDHQINTYVKNQMVFKALRIMNLNEYIAKLVAEGYAAGWQACLVKRKEKK